MQCNYHAVKMQLLKAIKQGQNRLRLLNPLAHPARCSKLTKSSLFLKTMISDYFFVKRRMPQPKIQ